MLSRLCRVFLWDLFCTRYRIPIKIYLKRRITPTNPFVTLLKVYLFVFIALRSRGIPVTYLNQTSLQVRQTKLLSPDISILSSLQVGGYEKNLKSWQMKLNFHSLYHCINQESFLKKNPVLLSVNMARSTCMLISDSWKFCGRFCIYQLLYTLCIFF